MVRSQSHAHGQKRESLDREPDQCALHSTPVRFSRQQGSLGSGAGSQRTAPGGVVGGEGKGKGEGGDPGRGAAGTGTLLARLSFLQQ